MEACASVLVPVTIGSITTGEFCNCSNNQTEGTKIATDSSDN